MSSLDGLIIVKQGWLQKKSKYIGSWRKRYCVINGESIFTFKNEGNLENHTECIPLSSIVAIGADQDLNCDTIESDTFYLQVDKKKYYFCAGTISEKREWLMFIQKYMHQCITVTMHINCISDKSFNNKFDLRIPYNDKTEYSVYQLLIEVMHYQHTCHPLKFGAKSININDKDLPLFASDTGSNLDRIITEFDKTEIETNGITLDIDIKFKESRTKQLISYFELIKEKSTL